VGEIIRLIEMDGWVTIAGKPSRDLSPGLERSILQPRIEGVAMLSLRGDTREQ